MNEFNLSERMNDFYLDENIDLFRFEDVKEFIRLLKTFNYNIIEHENGTEEKEFMICESILDKIAGEELI